MKLIRGNKKEKPAFDYGYAYYRMLKKEISKGERDVSYARAVFLGIKHHNAMSTDFDKLTIEELKNFLSGVQSIVVLVGSLTPREFIEQFPITKRYDGNGDFKDYFSVTKDIHDNFPMDKAIGDNAYKFLMMYQNRDIDDFMVDAMVITSALHQKQTGKDLITEFSEKAGLDFHPYTLRTDETGKKYFIDKDGRTLRLKKHTPRYLRVIK